MKEKTIHKMNLNDSPFKLISQGSKTIELRLYDEIPNKLNLFDNKTFMKSKTKFLAVATDLKTGEAEYLHIKDAKKDVDAIRASASLPMISNIVKYKNKEYLDGGISDSIPIKKAEQEGYEKNVVVLTRQKGYLKRNSRSYLAMKRKYKEYPEAIKRVQNRHKEYNETLEYIEKREKEGKVFIIRPKKRLNIKRIERNKEKLEQTYMEGYKTAREVYNELINFIEN